MKNPVAYYLLLIYLFALCKPVMPLVQDVVAHTFFEHEHIASVHQHGGSGHVKDEVGRLADKGSDDKNTGSMKSFDSVPLHLNASINFYYSALPPAFLSHSSFYLPGLSSISLAIQLPPPRV